MPQSGTSRSSNRVPLSEISHVPGGDGDGCKESDKEGSEEGDGEEEEEEGADEVPESDEEDESDEDELAEESESEEEEEPPAPDPRYNEQALLAAERLLSRTLAMANSDPEKGMAVELGAHILIYPLRPACR